MIIKSKENTNTSKLMYDYCLSVPLTTLAYTPEAMRDTLLQKQERLSLPHPYWYTDESLM